MPVSSPSTPLNQPAPPETLTETKLDERITEAARVREPGEQTTPSGRLALDAKDKPQANAITQIVSALPRHSSIYRLELNQVKLSAADIQTMATFLQSENCFLSTFSARECDIKKEGAEVLANAVAINSSLTCLALSHNPINEGNAAIAKALEKKNRTISTLWLCESGVDDKGAEAFAATIRTNRVLTNMDLCSKTMGVPGANAILNALSTNKTLFATGIEGGAKIAAQTGLVDQLKVITRKNQKAHLENLFAWRKATIFIALIRVHQTDLDLRKTDNDKINAIRQNVYLKAFLMIEEFADSGFDKKQYERIMTSIKRLTSPTANYNPALNTRKPLPTATNSTSVLPPSSQPTHRHTNSY